jgi:alginate O-acetyltransferase complex protein AlgI
VQFTSIVFLPFLAATLVAYYATPGRFRWLALLTGSVAFYLASDADSIAVLAGLTLLSCWIGVKLGARQTGRGSRGHLGIGLSVIFLVVAVVRLLPLVRPSLPTSIAPLGLSFFSLRLAGYLIDVSRGTISPERHPGIFATYVALLPELPSGPIERGGALLPQLRASAHVHGDGIPEGMKLFAWGLFKKVVVADRLGLFVSAFFDEPTAFAGAAPAAATLYFAFQVYCDFSGYSDMAIGIGQMFGLRLAKNFERPYTARSIAEFWTRWHISLSSWLRDYVFVPVVYRTGRALEGRLPRRSTEDKLAYAIATTATMLVCGLWHGVRLTYVIWGLFLAVVMVLSVFTRRLRTRLARRLYGRRFRLMHDAVRVIVTFSLINISWVFFRSHSLVQARDVLMSIPKGIVEHLSWILASAASGQLAGGGLLVPLLMGQTRLDLLVVVLGTGVVLSVESLQRRGSVRDRVHRLPVFVRWPLYAAFLVLIVVLQTPAASSFIYQGF